MYGQKFKVLRKERSISLDILSKGITSRSSLARWENGQGNMDVEKVIAMLKRLDINPSEFFTYKNDSLTTAIAYAYEYNDLQRLKKLALRFLREFHTHSRFIDLYHSAIACSAFLDLTSKNLFDKDDTDRLVFTLSKVSVWSQKYIELLGGSIFLLPANKLYDISKQIFPQLDYIRNASFHQFNNTLEMLLNVLIALIENKEIKLSEQFYLKLANVNIPEVNMLIRTRKKFYHGLICFCKSKNSQEIDEVFEILKSLKMTRILEDYKFAFNKVKQIYFPKLDY